MKRKMAAAAIALAAVFAVGATAVPARAARGPSYPKGMTICVDKYLVMDKDANVPNATFSYQITAGSAQSATANTLKVYAGNDANTVTGFPTIGEARFAPTIPDPEDDTKEISYPTFTSDQKDKVSDWNGIQDGKDPTKQDSVALDDPVTLDSTQKYAKAPISVDFSNVTFKEPGVYRYIITENASDTSKGITDDTDNSRVLDVYVEHDDSATATSSLKVAGYVLHNTGDGDAVAKDGSSATATKAQGWQNTYETEDLTIGKKVSGNQASHDEYFKFTVEIKNAIAGTIYNVDLDSGTAQETTGTNGINTESHTNPTSLTVGEDGTVTQDFWLQTGQSIKIQGLAKNTAYEVSEDSTTLNNEGYTASIADADFTGDKVTGDKDGTEGTTAIALNNNSIKDSAITADTSVTFTNTKEGTIPTGIMMSVIPGAVVCLLGGAGAVIVMKRKKREREA